MKTDAEKEAGRERFRRAVENAKKVLKPGDRLRVTKCPGLKRTIIFAGWEGNWIVSKSGINDYSAGCVDRVNGEAVDFSRGSGRKPKVKKAGGPLSSRLLRVSAFEDECSSKMLGDLWDASFNPGYNVEVTLAVSELRYIANALRFVQRESLQITKES